MAKYDGKGGKADLNNHSNQLNSNHSEYRGSGKSKSK